VLQDQQHHVHANDAGLHSSSWSRTRSKKKKKGFRSMYERQALLHWWAPRISITYNAIKGILTASCKHSIIGSSRVVQSSEASE